MNQLGVRVALLHLQELHGRPKDQHAQTQRRPAPYSTTPVVSKMDGTPGIAGDRSRLVMLKARSLPLLTWSRMHEVVSNIVEMRPSRKSVIAGVLPLYGTWTLSTWARLLNSAPDRWLVVPLPTDAKVTGPTSATRWMTEMVWMPPPPELQVRALTERRQVARND